MANKWVTIEGGSLAAGDKIYRAGVHEADPSTDAGKTLLAAAESYEWVKVSDEEPKNAVFTDTQIDYLRKMFPQLLELATAQQKNQSEYERLQAEKIAAAGPGANPDTMGVLTSADTKGAELTDPGLPGAFVGEPTVPDYDAVKAEVQLAGADATEETKLEAAKQVSGAVVAEDATDDATKDDKDDDKE